MKRLGNKTESQSRPKAVAGFGLVLLAGVFYLVDCGLAHHAHPSVKWIESGVYAEGFFGFAVTLCLAVFGFLYGAIFAVRSLFEKP